MGFFERLGGLVDRAVSGLFRLGSEVANEVREVLTRVVEAVNEGDWGTVFESVVETVKDLGERLLEVSGSVLSAFTELTGVAFESIGEIITVVETAGKLLIEQFEKSPEACLSILVSLVSSVAAFASGNIPMAVAYLAGAAVKMMRLRDQIAQAEPGMDVETTYPMPAGFEILKERHAHVASEDLDSYFIDFARA